MRRDRPRNLLEEMEAAQSAMYRNDDVMIRNVAQPTADAPRQPLVRSSDSALLARMRDERNDFLACWSADAHAKETTVLAKVATMEARLMAMGGSAAEIAGAAGAAAATANERHLAAEHAQAEADGLGDGPHSSQTCLQY